mmetsp:Transcript_78535/g.202239  ORF Transcript_78535/g.202239 Transcript_78535/m.202239 type:complete len:258 (+) Transcript_78535:1048-1821(+)
MSSTRIARPVAAATAAGRGWRRAIAWPPAGNATGGSASRAPTWVKWRRARRATGASSSLWGRRAIATSAAARSPREPRSWCASRATGGSASSATRGWPHRSRQPPRQVPAHREPTWCPSGSTGVGDSTTARLVLACCRRRLACKSAKGTVLPTPYAERAQPPYPDARIRLQTAALHFGVLGQPGRLSLLKGFLQSVIVLSDARCPAKLAAAQTALGLQGASSVCCIPHGIRQQNCMVRSRTGISISMAAYQFDCCTA